MSQSNTLTSTPRGFPSVIWFQAINGNPLLSIITSIVQKTNDWNLSIYLCHHLSIYLCHLLSIYLSIYLCHLLSIYLSIYVTIYLSIYVTFYLSIYPSIYLSLFISLYLSMSVSFFLSIYLSSFILINQLLKFSLYIRAVIWFQILQAIICFLL